MKIKFKEVNPKQKNGFNAFRLASERGHKDIVKLLIEKGLKK